MYPSETDLLKLLGFIWNITLHAGLQLVKRSSSVNVPAE